MTTLICAGALFMTIACSDDQEPTTSGDTSATTPSTTTTVEPSCMRMNVTEFEDVEPGTYCVDPDSDDSTPLLVTYDVTAKGWTSWPGAVKKHPTGHTMLTITSVENLVTHGCENPIPREPPVGPTVDDLATALSELAPFELTEPPRDVTFLGYQGKHLKLTVPDLEVTGSRDHEELADCVRGNLYSWIDASGSPFYGYNAEPGRSEEFWILDVAGTRIMVAINASPASPDQDLDELETIIDSVDFVA